MFVALLFWGVVERGLKEGRMNERMMELIEYH